MGRIPVPDRPPLSSLPDGGRIAVIRLRSLGDCVLTTPALRLLKQARPDVRIAVVVEPRFRDVFEGNPDIETCLAPALGVVRRWKPHLALNLHGGTRSLWLTHSSGAALRAGFSHHRLSRLYSISIPRAQEILGEERAVHTAEHLASAVFFLGVPHGEVPRACLFASPGPPPVDPPYAVLHPFASQRDKTWPAARFAEVAQWMRDEQGLTPVFLGGAADDYAPFAEFRRLVSRPLAEVKRLLRAASVFVGNDSGPAHMAAAFGLPVVVLFGASRPEVWRPWKTPSEVLSSPAGLGAIDSGAVREALSRLRVAA